MNALWERPDFRSAAGDAIAKVAAKPKLSNDLREIITRAMAD